MGTPEKPAAESPAQPPEEAAPRPEPGHARYPVDLEKYLEVYRLLGLERAEDRAKFWRWARPGFPDPRRPISVPYELDNTTKPLD